MKAGIYIKGKLKNGHSAIAKDDSILSKLIQDFFTDYSHGTFRSFLSFNEDDEHLFIRLHPIEMMVEFVWHSSHMICRAQTSTVGPGYHAYLMGLLLKMGDQIGITWTSVSKEEGNPYIKDRYFERRDFNDLQEDMLQCLKSICQTCTKADDGHTMINFPIDYPHIAEEFYAASQLTIWTKEWIYETAFAESGQLEMAGKDFFIWWDAQADANFHRRTGIALLNTSCYWRRPESVAEIETLSLIHACFGEARELQPAIALPEIDWSTVQQLLNSEEVEIHDTEYGYRKNTMTFVLSFGWRINLPGYFYYTIDEYANEIYHGEGYDVRIFNRIITEEENSDASFITNYFSSELTEETEIIATETSIEGNAIIRPHRFENKEMWILKGIKIVGDEYSLSAICYPTEAKKAWAIYAWNSIRK